MREERRYSEQALVRASIRLTSLYPKGMCTYCKKQQKKSFLNPRQGKASGFRLFQSVLQKIPEGQISTGEAAVQGDTKARQGENWNVHIQIFMR